VDVPSSDVVVYMCGRWGGERLDCWVWARMRDAVR
jgi:hypothetical protein